MRNIFFTTMFLTSAFIVLTSCERENEFEVIDQCRDIKSQSDCRNCCKTEGYDAGEYAAHVDACQCRIKI